MSTPASVPAIIRTPISYIGFTFSPTAIPASSATYGTFTLIVGHTTMPRSAISAATGSENSRSLVSVTHVQCSMVLTPAATARLMPSRPWACAATAMSTRRASATITASCSVLNCAYHGAEPLVMNPPVAMTLIRSAPCLWWVRTIRRRSSSLSASPPMNQQCPPVTVTGGPAATSRGPRARPDAIASRTTTLKNERAPRSRAVVTPTPSRSRALASISTSCCSSVSACIRAAGSGPPSKPRWTWQSISPGRIVAPG